jgi:hypothetical protein
MVEQLQTFDPDWETRERGECEALRKVSRAAGQGRGARASCITVFSASVEVPAAVR